MMILFTCVLMFVCVTSLLVSKEDVTSFNQGSPFSYEAGVHRGPGK